MSYNSLSTRDPTGSSGSREISTTLRQLLETELLSAVQHNQSSDFDQSLGLLISKVITITRSTELAIFWRRYIATFSQVHLPQCQEATEILETKRKPSGQFTDTEAAESNPKLTNTPETKEGVDAVYTNSGTKKNISEFLSFKDHSSNELGADEAPAVLRENVSPCKLFPKHKRGYDLLIAMNPKLSAKLTKPDAEPYEVERASSACSRSEFLLKIVGTNIVCEQKKVEMVKKSRPEVKQQPHQLNDNNVFKNRKMDFNSKVLEIKSKKLAYPIHEAGIRAERSSGLIRKVVKQKSLTQNLGHSQTNNSSIDLVHDRFDDAFECYDDIACFDQYDSQPQEHSNMTMCQTVPVESVKLYSAKKVISSENKENYTPLKFNSRSGHQKTSPQPAERTSFVKSPLQHMNATVNQPPIPAGLFSNNLNINKEMMLAHRSPLKKASFPVQGTALGGVLRSLAADQDVLAFATPIKDAAQASVKKPRQTTSSMHQDENTDPALVRLLANPPSWLRSPTAALKPSFQE